eukprot:1212881-Amphidinium_carterae.1
MVGGQPHNMIQLATEALSIIRWFDGSLGKRSVARSTVLAHYKSNFILFIELKLPKAPNVR